MERFRRSWDLAKQSWQVMRSQPSLAIFPIVSGFTTIVVSLSFMLPLFFSMMGSGAFDSHQGFSFNNIPYTYYLVTFVYYFVSYFVVIFFNVGLIHCAHKVLNNEETSLGDGIGMALRRLGPILGWSLVSATVGTILKLVTDKLGQVGQIVGVIVTSLIGAVWNIATFFVVPTLAIEGVGPFTAIKQSIGTIKKTWGETLIGNVGISWAISILALVPIPLFIASCFTQTAWIILTALGIMILWWLALAVVGSCLNMIYITAVYHYAHTGQAPTIFTLEQMQVAFLPAPENKVTNYLRNRR